MPVDNGAFRYGYGIFETMLVREGVIALVAYHMERFFAGLRQLYLDMPAAFTPGNIEAQVLRTVKRNNRERLCRVRLQAYAGAGGLYGPEISKPGYVIECFPLDEAVINMNENGLVVGFADGLFKSSDALSNLKSCNALIYAIAARQAKANKWNDALVMNTRGNIIESTIANIFWAKGDVIYTPPLSEGCVAGVMRRYILDKVPEVREAELTNELLAAADEVFLTNAIKRIKWVGVLGNQKYGNKIAASLIGL